LAAQAEGGNLWLVRGSWNDQFVAEACLFPNGRYKDQVDAASRAFGRLVARRQKTLTGAPQVVKG
jgi:phage terminase large subunit-like protein